MTEAERIIRSARMSGQRNPQYGRKGILSPNWGKKHTQETISLMRKRASENNPFTGRKHSAEARRKISEAQKGNSHTKGRKLSEEHREKLRQSKAWCGNPMDKPDVRAKVSATRSNGIWITDGIKNRFIQIGTDIPPGWNRGMRKKN